MLLVFMGGLLDCCRYQAELEGLYTALEERLRERLHAMKEGKDASVQDRIKQVTVSSFSSVDSWN